MNCKANVTDGDRLRKALPKQGLKQMSENNWKSIGELAKELARKAAEKREADEK